MVSVHNPDIICAKIIFRSATLQSSLFEALGSALRRLRNISQLRVYTCVCTRVLVLANTRCNNLFFFSKTVISSVQSAMWWMYRALCFVCACLNMHAVQQLFPFQQNQR